MSCVWEGHANDLWDALQLLCIVDHLLHPYSIIFKNSVSANLTRWHHRFANLDAKSTTATPKLYRSVSSPDKSKESAAGSPLNGTHAKRASAKLHHRSQSKGTGSIEHLSEKLEQSSITPQRSGFGTGQNLLGVARQGKLSSPRSKETRSVDRTRNRKPQTSPQSRSRIESADLVTPTKSSRRRTPGSAPSPSAIRTE